MHKYQGAPWLTAIKWIGTGTGIIGAVLVAANVGMVGWGFVIWAVSSASWVIAGYVMREPSLALLQGVFLAVDLIGIWRWLLI